MSADYTKPIPEDRQLGPAFGGLVFWLADQPEMREAFWLATGYRLNRTETPVNETLDMFVRWVYWTQWGDVDEGGSDER